MNKPGTFAALHGLRARYEELRLQEIIEMRRLVDAGVPVIAIAGEMGVTRDAVYKMLRRLEQSDDIQPVSTPHL